jgi:hypothetical protein
MKGKDIILEKILISVKKTTHPFVGRDSYKEACQQ